MTGGVKSIFHIFVDITRLKVTSLFKHCKWFLLGQSQYAQSASKGWINSSSSSWVIKLFLVCVWTLMKTKNLCKHFKGRDQAYLDMLKVLQNDESAMSQKWVVVFLKVVFYKLFCCFLWIGTYIERTEWFRLNSRGVSGHDEVCSEYFS